MRYNILGKFPPTTHRMLNAHKHTPKTYIVTIVASITPASISIANTRHEDIVDLTTDREDSVDHTYTWESTVDFTKQMIEAMGLSEEMLMHKSIKLEKRTTNSSNHVCIYFCGRDLTKTIHLKSNLSLTNRIRLFP